MPTQRHGQMVFENRVWINQYFKRIIICHSFLPFRPMAKKTGTCLQGCLVDLSGGRTNPFRIKLKNRCPVILPEIARLHIGQRSIILPRQFPILLLAEKEQVYLLFQIIHEVRVFTVAHNFSRNTNVVKKTFARKNLSISYPINDGSASDQRRMPVHRLAADTGQTDKRCGR